MSVDAVLLAPGIEFSTRDYEFERSRADEKSQLEPLEIAQDPSGELAAGIGATVWDAGLVLAKYLEQSNCRNQMHGKIWLELGSGTGIIGLVAAQLGARVVLSDRSNALALLRHNLAVHKGRFVDPPVIVAIDWIEVSKAVEDGREPEVISNLRTLGLWPLDGLLIGDCTWLEDILEPLLATVLCLTKGPPGHTVDIILSHEHRNKSRDAVIMSSLDSRLDGALKQVPTGELHPEWRCDEISVWRGCMTSS